MSTRYERTKPLYPTFGPDDGTGRDWHQYFKEAKDEYRNQVPDPADADGGDDDDPVGTISVVLPAVEVPENWFNVGAPQALRTWRNRLLANDWTFKCGGAVAYADDEYHKNGNLKKAAHWIDTWWIDAIKDGKYITILYMIRDGSVYSAWTSRRVKGEWFTKYSDAEMKRIVEGDQE